MAKCKQQDKFERMGFVAVPKGLLAKVLDVAEMNSVAIEGEWSRTKEDAEKCEIERADIATLRRFCEIESNKGACNG